MASEAGEITVSTLGCSGKPRPPDVFHTFSPTLFFAFLLAVLNNFYIGIFFICCNFVDFSKKKLSLFYIGSHRLSKERILAEKEIWQILFVIFSVNLMKCCERLVVAGYFKPNQPSKLLAQVHTRIIRSRGV